MVGNQKIKILFLMKILLENTDDLHGLTLDEIAEKLSAYGIDAERKTLYDDFEVLRTFGIGFSVKTIATIPIKCPIKFRWKRTKNSNLCEVLW